MDPQLDTIEGLKETPEKKKLWSENNVCGELTKDAGLWEPLGDGRVCGRSSG